MLKRSVALIALAVAAVASIAGQPPLDTLRLELNIPAFELQVVRDSLVVSRFQVAVGMREYPTPAGDFAVTRIVWNPWWVPPPSDWARGEPVTPPGPANPMGKVKLLLGGSLYIHASPFRASIGHAESHGCVRMLEEDAVALAQLIAPASGAADSSRNDELLGSWRTTATMDMTRTIAVAVRYRIAELRGDSLLLFPDIYRRHVGAAAAVALEALATASVDTIQLDRMRLAAAMDSARTRRVAVALADLQRL